MRDEKQRQKKLERKRKKREQKRRMSEAEPVWHEGSDLGDRKLSDTLLEFSSPLFASVPKEQLEPEEVQEVLEFAADAWNIAVSLRPADLTRQLVDLSSYHARLRDVPETQVAEVMLELVERKLRYFAHDLRAVLGIHVRWSDAGDDLRIRAVGAVLEPGTWTPIPLTLVSRSLGRNDPHPSPLPEGEGAHAAPT